MTATLGIGCRWGNKSLNLWCKNPKDYLSKQTYTGGAHMSAAQPSRAARQDCILVVEDDTSMCDTVCQLLKAEGDAVIFRQSAEHFEQVLARQAAVDTVLMDLSDPLQGLELLPLLKQKWPQAEVVFLCRLEDMDLWMEAIQRGAYDYLPKPVDPEELRRVLSNAVRKHRVA
jgi:DNA-binding NtrC family response regulator